MAAADDRYIPADVRTVLEERFLRPVEEMATLEVISADGSLAATPGLHPALYADHGIVHARDVAANVLAVAGTVRGRLVPERTDERWEFVVGLAVLLAYFHDVGMSDPSPDGRRIHPLHAAHVPFSGEMDDVLTRLWESDGPVVRRITFVADVAPFRADPDVVLRELAALGALHSKSAFAGPLYADFRALRRVLQLAVLLDLDDHRRAGRFPGPEDQLPSHPGSAARWYGDAALDAYAWLDSPETAHAALADDAIDAVRLVRVADALRQRGTTLRTTAGYEIFIDVDTGKAVFSLPTAGGDRLFLLRVDSPLSAGEANIRRAELTPDCNLRISFHRGRFSTPAAARAASDATARVVADVGPDLLGAFEIRRPSVDLPTPARDPASVLVELERPADDPAFAEAVAVAAARLDPLLAARIVVVADLENAAPTEAARFLQAETVAADGAEAEEILRELATRGMRVEAIDRVRAFEDVRRIRVGEGEVLAEAGSSPAFVYVPVDCGLRLERLGGYGRVDVPAWIPIGATGVVRRAERNSTVVAAEGGEVLIIPGELFAREWFQPYGTRELADLLT
jgi:hypothetical protein